MMEGHQGEASEEANERDLSEKQEREKKDGRGVSKAKAKRGEYKRAAEIEILRQKRQPGKGG